ncbi:hypothetical protein D3C85_1180630 [compost metagenome]
MIPYVIIEILINPAVRTWLCSYRSVPVSDQIAGTWIKRNLVFCRINTLRFNQEKLVNRAPFSQNKCGSGIAVGNHDIPVAIWQGDNLIFVKRHDQSWIPLEFTVCIKHSPAQI